MKKAIISLSGGMDSTCLLVRLLNMEFSSIQAISFDYGQRHKIELEKAVQATHYLKEMGFDINHHIIDLTAVGKVLDSALTGTKNIPEGHYESEEMKDTVVPNRNIIFSSILYGIALSNANKDSVQTYIALGMHGGDNAIYPDCRIESVEAAKRAYEISNWGSELVHYITPYINSNKTGILKQCLVDCQNLGIDFDFLLRCTSTSYNPIGGKASGTSSSDIERIEAFLNIDREDPIEYVGGWEAAIAHAKTILNKKQ